MRPLNFVLIFIVCIGLVLFSLENTAATTIRVVEGVEFEAPLAIELIAAAGFGALLAWIYSLLSQVQRMLTARQNIRQMRQQEQRIQELEKDLKQIHQQGQRIKDLEGDVEKIQTEEKTDRSKTVLPTANSTASSPETDVQPVVESEALTDNSTDTPSPDTEKETINTEA